MRDYDLSFERLADGVDAAAEARLGASWEGPDLRMRCTTPEAVCTWPEVAPYDGGRPVVRNVRGYGVHATASDPRRPLPRALCGFSCSTEKGRVVEGMPDCRECLREIQLGADRSWGRW
ncbi:MULTISPECIES: hypothetical protein [unclassified Streptomyces]|uniref:hypothetical protein n=1 Tax=unclassified Streptomyces TaxID=2593676 RepID=UPI0037F5CCA7